MKRAFTDLHLKANPKDPHTTQRIIDKAAQLGYCQISIPLTLGAHEEQLNTLKTACTQTGIEFVSRVDFKPRNQEDLMRFLRKFRRKIEVICIICDEKELARHAAKDRRVDLLNFPSFDYRKRFFDRAEAELASNAQAAIEFDLKPLIMLEGPPRVRLFANLRRETAIAREFKVPIVLSSGVGEWHLMRAPRDLASLAYLFGLGECEALNAISSNPNAIVSRNRFKLSDKFVAPGISVVKEGKDP
ncbi:MAG: hypothetical protein NWE98_08645 [Candidatus Bathyarchaeota archaeon]|nr:hypothetical protein [Candidatus Bathyarchaeota archaeon]